MGLPPSNKLLVSFISLVVATIPLGYVYNSVAIILFVLYSFLSVKKENVSFSGALLIPLAFFALMCLSLIWTIDFKSSLKALSKEASLLFIPIAFCLNRQVTQRIITKVLSTYSFAMCLFAIYFIIRATVRYNATGNIDVFFYHELSTMDINAIYLSALFSIAMFYFLAKKSKGFLGYTMLVFLMLFIFLLSSKNIIVMDILLIGVYYLFYSGWSNKIKITAVILLCAAVGGLGYNSKIKERIMEEFRPVERAPDALTGVAPHNITLHEAWNQETFDANDYFNGTAFRVYQIRIFTELLERDPILFTGYGLNASGSKIEEKGIEHNLAFKEGDGMIYNKQNFHNQYVEAFADLGIFGLLLVLAMHFFNVKNALRSKDFVHIAFAILMIALFLTESFLWRQRGVVCFTVFYCLFNSFLPGYTEKEKE